MDSVLSVKATCDATFLSRATVNRLIASGELRSTKIGARRLVFTDSIRELLERGVEHVA
jgi:excisionase family DNA binding protein